MSKSLVLTLGHNASAIAIQDGHILGGYEEERFTKIKSDSAFPIQSINRLKYYFGSDFDDVCVGHWFTAGSIVNGKYIDMETIKAISTDVYSIDNGLSHHDSHMLSTQAFGKCYDFPADHMVLVADGFGTFGECISVYNKSATGSQLLARYFGYSKSLGMLYQYATAYLGMKMHNHEYKMLGYEAHIHEVLSVDKLVRLFDIIASDAHDRVKYLYNVPIELDTDPIVSKSALAATQHEITNLLDSVLERLELRDISQFTKRVVIAHYVQSIVESVIGSIVSLYKPQNLMVVGGLFYNVKLNHKLADMVGKFSVFPLAGDQGAGLGVYHANHRDLIWPGHLNWGHRDLSQVTEGDGIVKTPDLTEAISLAIIELDKNGMVNVVRGSMEFGPRSLCNTATIAKPTMEVVEKINAMNDRTTVMPMAPAMTYEQAAERLLNIDKVVGSLEYMVVTRDVRSEFTDSMLGGSHFYKLSSRHTCRPQIINRDDVMMRTLLNTFGPLINTSFNFHGVPIAFEKDTIEYSHKMQRKNSDIKTIILNKA